MIDEQLRAAFLERAGTTGSLASLLNLAQTRPEPEVLEFYGQDGLKSHAGEWLEQCYAANPKPSPREIYQTWQIAAFGSVQSPALDSRLWLAVLLTRIAFVVPEMTFPVMDALSEGWLKGQAARNRAIDWEKLQAKSPDEVCQELELEPPTPANEELLEQTLNLMNGRNVPPALQKRFWDEVEEITGLGNIIEKIASFVTSYDPFLHEAYAAAMYQHAGLPQAYVEGYLRPPLDIQTLRGYPAGTLGYAFYHQLVDNGLDVEILKINEQVPASVRGGIPQYTGMRILQTHDIWHCLTAYTVDGLDEIALQGFQLAQLGSAFSANLLSMLLTRATLRHPDTFAYLMQAISEGWQHGRKTPSLLPVKWEQHWADNLDDLRHQYRIEPYTGNLLAAV